MLLDEITVIVPTKNEARNIPGLLQSIPREVRLVVVDASEDNTQETVFNFRRQRTTVISSPDRIAAARNRGANISSTKWLLFTDADVVFTSNYFAKLIQLKSGDAYYGPKLSQDAYISYYRKFSRWQARFDRLGIPAVSGSNFLVRSEVFHRVGGFRPDLLVNEDTELGYRIKKSGFRVNFTPNLVVHARDHRRLEQGTLRKDIHTVTRCALLYLQIMPGLVAGRDWGYWSRQD
jgi:glycosyltransferase involved in cell wall biosynthesis